MDSISFVSCELMLVVSLILTSRSAEYSLFMTDFDFEVKYSLYSRNEQNTHTMRNTAEKWYVRQKYSEKCQICSEKLNFSGLALLH